MQWATFFEVKKYLLTFCSLFIVLLRGVRSECCAIGGNMVMILGLGSAAAVARFLFAPALAGSAGCEASGGEEGDEGEGERLLSFHVGMV